MAVTQQQTVYTYVANGATTVFPYGCRILDDGDLTVQVDGVTKTIGVDYTLSGVGAANGGNVTFTVAPANAATVLLFRATQVVRDTNYQTAGDFLAAVVNADFDRAVMILQDILAGVVAIDNAVRVPSGESIPQLPAAAVRAGYLLGFDVVNGDPLTVAPTSGSAAALALDLATSGAAAKGAGQLGYSDLTAYTTGVGLALRRMNNIRKYGALNNDGATNDLATFQAAAASGDKFIDARGLDCVVQGTVNIPANQVWLLAGTTLRMTGAAQTMLSANGVSGWALVGPFRIVGDGSTVGTSRGIYVNNCERYRVDGYSGESIRGHAAYLDAGSNTTPRGDRGHWLNMRARGCYYGLETIPGGNSEYITITAPMITSCTFGLVLSAGNVVVQGGNVVDNTNGVFLGPGTNHGHGMLVGVHMSHNTNYNFQAQGVTLGFDLVDCHAYGNDAIGNGKVYFNGCAGVHWKGGHIDALIQNDGTVGINYLSDVTFPGTFAGSAISGTNPYLLYIARCKTLANGPSVLNDPAPLYARARRTTSFALTAGSSVTALLDSKPVDRSGLYNTATGVFTVPTGSPLREYEVIVDFTVTAASGLTSVGYVKVQVNATDAGYIPLIAISGTLAIASGTVPVRLTGADAVRVQVQVNAGAGTPVLDASYSQMSIKVLE